MTITLFPDNDISLDTLCGRIAKAQPAPPFEAAQIELLHGLSRFLMTDRRLAGRAEWTALGYWLRRASLAKLKSDFMERLPADTIIAPRGVAVHLPPANVDTIFVYSWALSLLCGNVNLVRLPSSRPEQIDIVLNYLTDALEKSGLGPSNLFVTYPADNRINASMFALADMRLIWGGDQKISALSTMQAKPSCHTLNFADRFSLGLYKVEAYTGLSGTERDELVRKAYNDVYIFDQLACSSSRLVAWLGGTDSLYKEAISDFSGRLSAQARRMNYEVAPHTSMAKFAAANRSTIDHRVSGLASRSAELTVVELSGLEDVREEASGGGFLYSAHVAEAQELKAFLRRKDQTIAYFGFDRDELLELARMLSVRGADRFVPVGSALDFDFIWDGFDLPGQMLRYVRIR
ncbi:MAG: acyl-CoA reductase [Hoeflea sp.]|uniref:acyl-CoA reductase n=1 Tax=Hoeflea sp. TaxID=1940281 RepID=UPI0032EEA0D1